MELEERIYVTKQKRGDQVRLKCAHASWDCMLFKNDTECVRKHNS